MVFELSDRSVILVDVMIVWFKVGIGFDVVI